MAKHVPPPAGLRSPIQWGTEERLRELFGGQIAEVRSRSGTTRSAIGRRSTTSSTGARFYGPTLKAFETVGDAGRAALEADILELIGRFNRADDGTMVVPNEYLEAVIVKR